MDISRFLRKHYLRIVFAIAGATAGFLYWKFVGCKTGTCPIKSVWYWSTLYGAAFGFLIGDLVVGYIKKRSTRNADHSESTGE